MPNKKNVFKFCTTRLIQTISYGLVLCLLVQDLAWAAPDLKLGVKGKEQSLKWAKTLLPELPESIVKLDDAWRGTGGSGPSGTVILIQDAHANPSGQMNLAKTLDLIFSHGGEGAQVFLEAGFGDDSLSFLRNHGSLSERKRIAYKYLSKGLLNGEEYLDLTSSHNFALWGVEDKGLYLKALKNYKVVAQDRSKFKDYLSKIQTTLDILKPRLLNPVLYKLDQDRQSYLKDNLSLTDYADTLLRGNDRKRYPNLQKISSLKSLEQRLSQQNISPQHQKRIVERLLKRSKSLDYKSILEEVRRLESDAFQALTLNADEQALLDGQRSLEFLKKLLNLTLTPEEYEEYKSIRHPERSEGSSLSESSRKDSSASGPQNDPVARLTGFLNQNIMMLGSYYERALFLEPGFDSIVANAESFYGLTLQRDEAFVQNMLKKSPRALSILIAGGYHTPNLKRLLREKNIAYIVLTPQVTRETSIAKYEKILLNQNLLTLNPATLNITQSHMRIAPQRNIAGSRLVAEVKDLNETFKEVLRDRKEEIREAKTRIDDNLAAEMIGQMRSVVEILVKSHQLEAGGLIEEKLGRLKELKNLNSNAKEQIAQLYVFLKRHFSLSRFQSFVTEHALLPEQKISPSVERYGLNLGDYAARYTKAMKVSGIKKFSGVYRGELAVVSGYHSLISIEDLDRLSETLARKGYGFVFEDGLTFSRAVNPKTESPVELLQIPVTDSETGKTITRVELVLYDKPDVEEELGKYTTAIRQRLYPHQYYRETIHHPDLKRHQVDFEKSISEIAKRHGINGRLSDDKIKKMELSIALSLVAETLFLKLPKSLQKEAEELGIRSGGAYPGLVHLHSSMRTAVETLANHEKSEKLMSIDVDKRTAEQIADLNALEQKLSLESQKNLAGKNAFVDNFPLFILDDHLFKDMGERQQEEWKAFFRKVAKYYAQMQSDYENIWSEDSTNPAAAIIEPNAVSINLLPGRTEAQILRALKQSHSQEVFSQSVDLDADCQLFLNDIPKIITHKGLAEIKLLLVGMKPILLRAEKRELFKRLEKEVEGVEARIRAIERSIGARLSEEPKGASVVWTHAKEMMDAIQKSPIAHSGRDQIKQLAKDLKTIPSKAEEIRRETRELSGKIQFNNGAAERFDEILNSSLKNGEEREQLARLYWYLDQMFTVREAPTVRVQIQSTQKQFGKYALDYYLEYLKEGNPQDAAALKSRIAGAGSYAREGVGVTGDSEDLLNDDEVQKASRVLDFGGLGFLFEDGLTFARILPTTTSATVKSLFIYTKKKGDAAIQVRPELWLYAMPADPATKLLFFQDVMGDLYPQIAHSPLVKRVLEQKEARIDDYPHLPGFLPSKLIRSYFDLTKSESSPKDLFKRLEKAKALEPQARQLALHEFYAHIGKALYLTAGSEFKARFKAKLFSGVLPNGAIYLKNYGAQLKKYYALVESGRADYWSEQLAEDELAENFFGDVFAFYCLNQLLKIRSIYQMSDEDSSVELTVFVKEFVESLKEKHARGLNAWQIEDEDAAKKIESVQAIIQEPNWVGSPKHLSDETTEPSTLRAVASHFIRETVTEAKKLFENPNRTENQLAWMIEGLSIAIRDFTPLLEDRKTTRLASLILVLPVYARALFYRGDYSQMLRFIQLNLHYLAHYLESIEEKNLAQANFAVSVHGDLRRTVTDAMAFLIVNGKYEFVKPLQEALDKLRSLKLPEGARLADLKASYIEYIKRNSEEIDAAVLYVKDPSKALKIQAELSSAIGILKGGFKVKAGDFVDEKFLKLAGLKEFNRSQKEQLVCLYLFIRDEFKYPNLISFISKPVITPESKISESMERYGIRAKDYYLRYAKNKMDTENFADHEGFLDQFIGVFRAEDERVSGYEPVITREDLDALSEILAKRGFGFVFEDGLTYSRTINPNALGPVQMVNLPIKDTVSGKIVVRPEIVLFDRPLSGSEKIKLFDRQMIEWLYPDLAFSSVFGDRFLGPHQQSIEACIAAIRKSGRNTTMDDEKIKGAAQLVLLSIIFDSLYERLPENFIARIARIAATNNVTTPGPAYLRIIGRHGVDVINDRNERDSLGAKAPDQRTPDENQKIDDLSYSISKESIKRRIGKVFFSTFGPLYVLNKNILSRDGERVPDEVKKLFEDVSKYFIGLHDDYHNIWEVPEVDANKLLLEEPNPISATLKPYALEIQAIRVNEAVVNDPNFKASNPESHRDTANAFIMDMKHIRTEEGLSRMRSVLFDLVAALKTDKLKDLAAQAESAFEEAKNRVGLVTAARLSIETGNRNQEIIDLSRQALRVYGLKNFATIMIASVSESTPALDESGAHQLDLRDATAFAELSRFIHEDYKKDYSYQALFQNWKDLESVHRGDDYNGVFKTPAAKQDVFSYYIFGRVIADDKDFEIALNKHDDEDRIQHSAHRAAKIFTAIDKLARESGGVFTLGELRKAVFTDVDSKYFDLDLELIDRAVQIATGSFEEGARLSCEYMEMQRMEFLGRIEENETRRKKLADELTKKAKAYADEMERILQEANSKLKSIPNSEEIVHEIVPVIKKTLNDVLTNPALADPAKFEQALATNLVDGMKNGHHAGIAGALGADSLKDIQELLSTTKLADGKNFVQAVMDWQEQNQILTKLKKYAESTLVEGVSVPELKKKQGFKPGQTGQASGARLAAKQEVDFIDTLKELSDDEKKLLKEHFVDMASQESKPLIGRADDVRKVVSALSKPSGFKNSVLLVGKKGVGKSALVRMIARSIKEKKIPGPLEQRRIYTLKKSLGSTPSDMNDALAKLLPILEKTKNKIIIFIDEFHVLTRGINNTTDFAVADTLKPYLEEGRVTMIGATTIAECKRFIESEPGGAFKDRFVEVRLEETDAETTKDILDGLKDFYEEEFGIPISEGAIEIAVELSERFLPEKSFPRKAVDLLENTLSHASSLVAQRNLQIDDLTKQLELKTKRYIGNKKKGKNGDDRATTQLHNQIITLTQGILKLKAERDALKITELSDQDVRRYLADTTGIDLAHLSQGEAQRMLVAEDVIGQKIIGQEAAVGAISKAIRRSRSGMRDPKRPIGSFVLAGPTGVGKTELAKALALFMFGDESKMKRLDMSEYMEKHNASRMIGSPPGYIGFEAGGELTEYVKKNPYAVILFDEIEKAHPDVFNTLLQILSDGRLTDGKGETVDFKNTVIILTSNVGMTSIADYFKGFEESIKHAESSEGIDLAIKGMNERIAEAVKKGINGDPARFKPEFLNRLDAVIPMSILSPENVKGIARIKVDKEIRARLESEKWSVTILPEVHELVAKEGYDPVFGARPLNRAIDRMILDPLSTQVLMTKAKEGEEASGNIVISAIGKEIHFKIDLKKQGVIQTLPYPEEQKAIYEALFQEINNTLDSADSALTEETLKKILKVDDRAGVLSSQSADYGVYKHNQPLAFEAEKDKSKRSNHNAPSKDSGVLKAQELILAALQSEPKVNAVMKFIQLFSKWAKENNVDAEFINLEWTVKDKKLLIRIKKADKNVIKDDEAKTLVEFLQHNPKTQEEADEIARKIAEEKGITGGQALLRLKAAFIALGGESTFGTFENTYWASIVLDEDLQKMADESKLKAETAYKLKLLEALFDSLPERSMSDDPKKTNLPMDRFKFSITDELCGYKGYKARKPSESDQNNKTVLILVNPKTANWKIFFQDFRLYLDEYYPYYMARYSALVEKLQFGKLEERESVVVAAGATDQTVKNQGVAPKSIPQEYTDMLKNINDLYQYFPTNIAIRLKDKPLVAAIVLYHALFKNDELESFMNLCVNQQIDEFKRQLNGLPVILSLINRYDATSIESGSLIAPGVLPQICFVSGLEEDERGSYRRFFLGRTATKFYSGDSSDLATQSKLVINVSELNELRENLKKAKITSLQRSAAKSSSSKELSSVSPESAESTKAQGKLSRKTVAELFRQFADQVNIRGPIDNECFVEFNRSNSNEFVLEKYTQRRQQRARIKIQSEKGRIRKLEITLWPADKGPVRALYINRAVNLILDVVFLGKTQEVIVVVDDRELVGFLSAYESNADKSDESMETLNTRVIAKSDALKRAQEDPDFAKALKWRNKKSAAPSNPLEGDVKAILEQARQANENESGDLSAVRGADNELAIRAEDFSLLTTKDFEEILDRAFLVEESTLSARAIRLTIGDWARRKNQLVYLREQEEGDDSVSVFELKIGQAIQASELMKWLLEQDLPTDNPEVQAAWGKAKIKIRRLAIEKITGRQSAASAQDVKNQGLTPNAPNEFKAQVLQRALANVRNKNIRRFKGGAVTKASESESTLVLLDFPQDDADYDPDLFSPRVASKLHPAAMELAREIVEYLNGQSGNKRKAYVNQDVETVFEGDVEIENVSAVGISFERMTQTLEEAQAGTVELLRVVEEFLLKKQASLSSVGDKLSKVSPESATSGWQLLNREGTEYIKISVPKNLEDRLLGKPLLQKLVYLLAVEDLVQAKDFIKSNLSKILAEIKKLNVGEGRLWATAPSGTVLINDGAPTEGALIIRLEEFETTFTESKQESAQVIFNYPLFETDVYFNADEKNGKNLREVGAIKTPFDQSPVLCYPEEMIELRRNLEAQKANSGDTKPNSAKGTGELSKVSPGSKEKEKNVSQWQKFVEELKTSESAAPIPPASADKSAQTVKNQALTPNITKIISQLESKLSDDNWAVCLAAATALGPIYQALFTQGKMSLETLESKLRDNNWAVRQAAAIALGPIYQTLITQGKKVSLETLESKLSDYERDAAATVLGFIYQTLITQGKKVFLKTLESKLMDRDGTVRRASVTALGSIYQTLFTEGKISLETLDSKLMDRNGTVRQAAATALGPIYQALFTQGKMSLETLESKLRDNNWAVRQAAAIALGPIYQTLITQGKKVSLKTLESKLSDGTWTVQQAAVIALGPIYQTLFTQGKMSLKTLDSKLMDRNGTVRQASVIALGPIYQTLFTEGKISLEALESKLSDDDEAVRQAAVTALGSVALSMIVAQEAKPAAPVPTASADKKAQNIKRELKSASPKSKLQEEMEVVGEYIQKLRTNSVEVKPDRASQVSITPKTQQEFVDQLKASVMSDPRLGEVEDEPTISVSNGVVTVQKEVAGNFDEILDRQMKVAYDEGGIVTEVEVEDVNLFNPRDWTEGNVIDVGFLAEGQCLVVVVKDESLRYFMDEFQDDITAIANLGFNYEIISLSEAIRRCEELGSIFKFTDITNSDDTKPKSGVGKELSNVSLESAVNSVPTVFRRPNNVELESAQEAVRLLKALIQSGTFIRIAYRFMDGDEDVSRSVIKVKNDQDKWLLVQYKPDQDRDGWQLFDLEKIYQDGGFMYWSATSQGLIISNTRDYLDDYQNIVPRVSSEIALADYKGLRANSGDTKPNSAKGTGELSKVFPGSTEKAREWLDKIDTWLVQTENSDQIDQSIRYVVEEDSIISMGFGLGFNAGMTMPRVFSIAVNFEKVNWEQLFSAIEDHVLDEYGDKAAFNWRKFVEELKSSTGARLSEEEEKVRKINLAGQAPRTMGLKNFASLMILPLYHAELAPEGEITGDKIHKAYARDFAYETIYDRWKGSELMHGNDDYNRALPSKEEKRKMLSYYLFGKFIIGEKGLEAALNYRDRESEIEYSAMVAPKIFKAIADLTQDRAGSFTINDVRKRLVAQKEDGEHFELYLTLIDRAVDIAENRFEENGARLAQVYVRFAASVYQAQKKDGEIAVGQHRFEIQFNAKSGELLLIDKRSGNFEKIPMRNPALWNPKSGEFQVEASLADLQIALHAAQRGNRFVMESLPAEILNSSTKTLIELGVDHLLADPSQRPLLAAALKRISDSPLAKNSKIVLKSIGNDIRVSELLENIPNKDKWIVGSYEELDPEYRLNAQRVQVGELGCNDGLLIKNVRFLPTQKATSGDIFNYEGVLQAALLEGKISSDVLKNATHSESQALIHAFEELLGRTIPLEQYGAFIQVITGVEKVDPKAALAFTVAAAFHLKIQQRVAGARLARLMAERAA